MMRASALLLFVGCLCVGSSHGSVSELVNIYIGTGGIGWGVGATDISAQVPFGAWRGGPDTSWHGNVALSFEHDSGYFYADKNIRAFSHTRLVGAGVADYGNIGIMPATELTNKSVSKDDGFLSSFSHESERVVPGYYSVHLDGPNVFSEISAAGSHAGSHRHSYAAGTKERVLTIDVCHYADRKQGTCHEPNVQINGDGSITGSLRTTGSLSGRSAFGGVAIYFVIRVLDQEGHLPSVGVWQDHVAYDGALSGSSKNGSLGAYLRYPPGTAGKLKGGVLEVQVGISFVSLDQAHINFAAQIGNLTFDEVVARAEKIWEDELSILKLSEDVEKDTAVKLYTALYHTLVSPTQYTEEGGAYTGFDNKVRVYSEGNLYTDMSIWDIHRSQAPWLNLLKPKLGNEIVRSLETIARDGGDLPKWPLANVYTGCMTGQHSIVMIADAISKNVSQNLDFDFLLPLMQKEATTPVPHSGRHSVESYMQYGYVPQDIQENGASLTLEFAFDDWAVSVVAEHVGDETTTQIFRNRSLNYVNVWDKDHEFMCPRYKDGSFHCRHETWEYFLDKDYTEGNAWQWTWAVPHDPIGLVKLFKSKEDFAKKLNECFARSTLFSSNFLPNPYYWAGNEPDLLHAWLFVFADRADLTQKWTRWISENKYNTKPEGIPGNDDYGTMSAWLAFASFGFYPLAGSPLYIVGSPSVPAANITLQDGQVLSIVAHGWTKKALYVSGVSLNGEALSGPVFEHSQIASGGILEFQMSEKPSKWGQNFDWSKVTHLWPKH